MAEVNEKIAGVNTIDASSITSGTIDSARLPSYVDDVVEYANVAAFPGTGETGKIYIALDTDISYRWSGSAYRDLKEDIAGQVHAATSKTTPVDADEVGIVDSADSNKLKRLTFANLWSWVKGKADTFYASINFLQSGTGAVSRTTLSKLQDYVCVKDFGAVGDGTTDDTAAIAAAHATGRPVFYPYGTYKHVGYFPSCEGGIIGEGWSDNVGAKTTVIVFYNCTSTTTAAITPKQAMPKSAAFRIEHIKIAASSWDGTTGCLGYGIDIGEPVLINNVAVSKFKRSNVFIHHVWPTSGPVTAPYESDINNLVCTYSGEHGCIVGRGGNSITMFNYQGKWNGAPSFGVAPSVAGNYDGLYVANTADGNDIASYTPQNLNIIGGDCSYNSRYGWNIHELAQSANVNPGYAEGNKTSQARVGDVNDCRIAFSAIAGNTAGFVNAQTYSAYFYRNAFFIGGKQVHPANDYRFIANPTQEDESGGTIQNAPKKTIFLSRSNGAAITTFIDTNATPDGTAINLASESVSTLRGFGAYALGIGSGSRHLKVTNNVVRLPDLYHQATGTGWTASSVLRGIGSAAPVAGTWSQGDIIYNSTPTAGGYVGWVCVSGGTPGTWKGFGAISA